MIATVELNILSNILAEIKARQYFRLIPDEAANTSKKNLPLVIIFVDVAKKNSEGFLGHHLL